MSRALVIIETVDAALVKLEAAATALAEAVEFQQVREIRSLAVAAEAYAREAADRRLLDYAQDLKINAERKAGEMLVESATKGERATKALHGKGIQSSVVADDTRPTLSQIGITRDQSSKFQQLAALSEQEFTSAKQLTKAVTHGVSAGRVLKMVETHRVPDRVYDEDQVRRLQPDAVVEVELNVGEQTILLTRCVADLHRISANPRALLSTVPPYLMPSFMRELRQVISLLKGVLDVEAQCR